MLSPFSTLPTAAKTRLPTPAFTNRLVTNPLLSMADIKATLGYPSTNEGILTQAIQLSHWEVLREPHACIKGEPYWHSAAFYEKFGGDFKDPPQVRRLTAYDRLNTSTPTGDRQASISVDAELPLATYQRYLRGIGFPLYEQPGGVYERWWIANPEHLVRLRRVVSFIDISGLIPIRLSGCPGLLSLVMDFSHPGQATMLMDAFGCHVLLIEPRHDLERDFEIFDRWGLEIIEVPEPLAPYCEQWDPRPGAKPQSRSYLVTSVEQGGRLYRIGEQLEAAAERMPAWNDQTGVTR